MEIDRLESLERLARLRDQGALSEAEFESEKAKLLQVHDPVGGEGSSGTGGDDEKTARGTRVRYSVLAGTFLVVAVGLGVYLATTTPGNQIAKAGQVVPEVASTLVDPSPPRITALMKFDIASECQPAEQLRILLDDMRALQPGDTQPTLLLPANMGKAVPTTRAIEEGAGAGAIVSELAVTGSWDGLRLSRLRTVSYGTGGNYSIQIEFLEPVDKVIRSLNAKGFDLPKPDELRNVDLSSGEGLSVGIESSSKGSALLCARSGGA